QAIPALIEQLAGSAGDADMRTRQVLERIDPSWQQAPAARDAVPLLITQLYSRAADGSNRVRLLLNEIDPNWAKSDGARQAVPLLLKALQHEDQDSRNRALRALAELGPQARSALPDLVQRLGQDSNNLGALVHALDRIDADWRQTEAARSRGKGLAE